MDVLESQLEKCWNIINKGYTNVRNIGKAWLNSFCSEFLQFANSLENFIATQITNNATECNGHVETIFLCLIQIITCIKYIECAIKAEAVEEASRQHFLDRIHWCLDQLRTSLRRLVENVAKKRPPLQESTFVELMDLVLDQLVPYSYNEDNGKPINVVEENSKAMFVSSQIRELVDLILGHTLAFANVALKQDKKALSALCQKVLRECISFQNECALIVEHVKLNDCSRKLKAVSLENSLYQLEEYINEALLRLVYTCFLDYNKFSIEKLRTTIRISSSDDHVLDELVADFDVNVDRTTQIGVFAIAFAPNLKIKTIVRSCLASLEYLDSCIIPSLQSKHSVSIYSEILEQHFNEEIACFKNTIQEIIDSQAFTGCFLDLLEQCIVQMEKKFNKAQLQDIVQMGEFLYEHFQMKINFKELRKQADRFKLYEKFTTMLRECQAILVCADQEETQRILKRFKIFRTVLRKFLDSLNNSTQAQSKKSNTFLMSHDVSESQNLFESVGVLPSLRNIFYRNESPRRQAISDSLEANYSKMPVNQQSPVMHLAAQDTKDFTVQQTKTSKTVNICKVNSKTQERVGSVCRKESLRTAMFKRQKITEAENVNDNSTSFQISDILDQLIGLPSRFSENS